METFHWKIRPDIAEPGVTVVKFGDGYEQRRPTGPNSRLAKYNVTVRVRKGGNTGIWRISCSDTGRSVSGDYTTTFEQVVI